ncbi:MAG: pantoate--beta-alanine ligase [bacterium]
MDIIEHPDAMRSRVMEARGRSGTVGYVPTMGALHRGHRRVIQEAKKYNETVAVSIFVNPTQFDTDEDAEVYPRKVEEDHEVLRDENVDIVFEPNYEAMYPDGDVTEVHVDLPLTDRYEGEIRPRFFQGVARIVSKFFNIIPADNAYFGEKDLQQYLMLERMVEDLHFPQTVHSVPVERDQNGVAYSSRNEAFDDQDWDLANRTFELMQEFRNRADSLTREDLESYRRKLNDAGLAVEYLDLVGIPEYEPTSVDDPTAVLILAGYVGETRLKDNRPLHVESLKEMDYG